MHETLKGLILQYYNIILRTVQKDNLVMPPLQKFKTDSLTEQNYLENISIFTPNMSSGPQLSHRVRWLCE